MLWLTGRCFGGQADALADGLMLWQADALADRRFGRQADALTDVSNAGVAPGPY